MRWSQALAVAFGAILLSLIIAFFGLRVLFLGRLTMPSVKEYESLAMTGLPMAQAIGEYRIDHGLLPAKLEDLVPKYWNVKSNGGWRFNGNSIAHHAGIPHTYVYSTVCHNEVM